MTSPAPDPERVFIAIGKYLWRRYRWPVIAALVIASTVVMMAIVGS